MADMVRTSYVAECFWPGVAEEDLRALDRRIEVSLSMVAGDGEPVRYLGWLLVIEDEVVLVLFRGSLGTIRRVAEHAQIPFGRMLQAALPPWLPTALIEKEAWE